MDWETRLEDTVCETGRPSLAVGFVLLPNFTLMALSCFVEVLRHAADRGDRSGQLLCSWTIMTHDGAAVLSSCGIRITPTCGLLAPKRFDYVVVVGGKLPEALEYDGRVLSYVDRAAREGTALVGACTGSFVLAKAGLLRGVRTSVHWYHYEDFLSHFPGALPVTDEIFSIDQGIITCAGGASTSDLAMYLVERHCGPERALKCMRQLVLAQLRPPAHPQFYSVSSGALPADPRLRKAVFLMERNLREPLSLDDLAHRVNVSSRQLSRLFKSHYAETITQHYRSLRLTYARYLLENTHHPLERIAQECGFTDASHMNRLFRAKFSLLPSQCRDSQSADA
ncbi:AraC family transcriptional regulator [Bordetella genomosp. 9]|uniref:AraC family transcriptional regulator n=1 Tax=Bordetella genomosp. 9 TaxID=1416803 RepID=A0A261RPE5_9BORD|nr:GlxA family transcriptional regulator [Bordetella genomosp. 9]OZI26781.1 AraC family transcriptional regulator [Bordetella genomosp. 9]